MKSLVLYFVLFAFTASVLAQDYEPPDIIARIETNISNQHHNLGDINGDGFDDFITVNRPNGYYREGLEIYYGGNPMDEEPGFTIPSKITPMKLWEHQDW